jgi:hypothetical protein
VARGRRGDEEIDAMRMVRFLVPVILLVLAAPAWAQGAAGYRGWGLRGGVADSPDQIVLGAQWDLGDLTPDLRFVPNFEIGLGDDHTIVGGTVPVHYVFRASGAVRPYVGGGVALAWVDRDLPHGGSDSEFELAVKAIGGVEWKLANANLFGLELALHGGDIYDLQLLATLSFR